MRREQFKKGLGTAEIVPCEPAIAATYGTWKIIYRIGDITIKPGGIIRINIPLRFSMPQTQNPKDEGFMTVRCSNKDVCFHTDYNKIDKSDMTSIVADNDYEEAYVETWGLSFFVYIDKGELIKNDIITFIYGERGFGSPGARTQEFTQQVEFAVSVDSNGRSEAPYSGFFLVDDPPKLKILPDKVHKIEISSNSVISNNDPGRANIISKDFYNNYIKETKFEISIKNRDGNLCVEKKPDYNINILSKENYSVIEIIDRSTNNIGASNPILKTKINNKYNIYWGDIHGHCLLDDGLGTLEEYLEYGRNMSNLDFCAATPHDATETLLSDDEWVHTKECVKRYYEPGRFVTLLAYEYNEEILGGDKNIYYREDDGPLYRCKDKESNTPEKLFRLLKDKDVLVIPHHTTSKLFGTNWDYFDQDLIRIAEIYSTWGNSESPHCKHKLKAASEYENGKTIIDALNRGYRLGIIASSDSHEGHPGNNWWMRGYKGYKGGLIAVFAENLTREDIWDAIYQRRVYGTMGERIILDFQINGNLMGSEITIKDEECLEFFISVIGTKKLNNIYLIKNGEIHKNFKAEDQSFTCSFLEDPEEKEAYYYIRAEQEDDSLAWSSPIWVN
jgi:hypothetical protein